MKNAMPDKVKTKAAWDNKSNSKKGGKYDERRKNSDVKSRPDPTRPDPTPFFPCIFFMSAVMNMNRISSSIPIFLSAPDGEANALDLISGTAGNDMIDGGDGDDFLFGQGKDDIIFGGKDNDNCWRIAA